jgi:single-strand DNA-binding protein
MADLRMPDLNKVILAGNLTRDPELRFLPSGMAVCKLGLASNRRYRTKDGENREETLFINATCWGKTAEFVGESFKKGRAVLVEGRLQMNEWDDKSTGQKRSAIDINADRVQSLSWEDRGGGSGGGGGRSRRPESGPEGPEPEDDIPF